MSGWLIALIVLAVGFAGLGLQMLSLQLNRFPADVRRPGPLVQISRSKPDTEHSAELRRLVTVVSYATINDQVAQVELQKIFDGLEAPRSPIVQASSSRRDHRRRSHQIELAIAALEHRWGLADPGRQGSSDEPQA